MNRVAGRRFCRYPFALLLFAATALLLSGCWDRTEVNDLALIMGAAIDKKTERTLELSVQVFVPKAGGNTVDGTSSGTQSGNEQTIVVSAEGVSLADAMSHIQEKISRRLFWGHNEVFIFGEERAKQGILEDVDFLFRSAEPRERANVFVSKHAAIDTLRLIPVLERTSSEVLREIALAHTGLDVTVKDLAEMLSSDTHAAVLPFIVMLPPQPGKSPQHTISYSNGCAMLKNGKMIGTIDNRVTRGVLWLKNQIKSSIFTVFPESVQGSVSLRLIYNRTRLIPKIEQGVWRMRVQIDTASNIEQNTTGRTMMDPVWTAKVEQSTNEDIRARVRQALRIAQQKKVDIFGFGDMFERRYPKEWAQAQSRWDELFASLQVEIVSHAKIRRPGTSNLELDRKTGGEAKS